MKLLIPVILLIVFIGGGLYRGLIRDNLGLDGPLLTLADAGATITLAIISWYAVQKIIFSVKARFEARAQIKDEDNA